VTSNSDFDSTFKGLINKLRIRAHKFLSKQWQSSHRKQQEQLWVKFMRMHVRRSKSEKGERQSGQLK